MALEDVDSSGAAAARQGQKHQGMNTKAQNTDNENQGGGPARN